MLNSGIILCDDIIELIGINRKTIKDKENLDFHCSLLKDPECLGGWIKQFSSARMTRHIKLLDEITLISQLRLRQWRRVESITKDTTYLREALSIADIYNL